MKAYLEIYKMTADVVTTSGDECPCDMGCNTDFTQLAQ